MAYTIMGGLSVATFPSIYAVSRRRSLGAERAGARRERAPNLDAIGVAAPAE
jgi:hypothetical protein